MQILFNEWANDNKPEASLEDFITWSAGYSARQAEINSLHAEIKRLQEVVAERIS